MTTTKEFDDLQAQIAALWAKALEKNAAQLLQNPNLAEALLNEISKRYEPLEQEEASAAGPNDGGLSQLIGLGSDTATDLGATRFAPKVESYDEQVTPERFKAVGDLYYIYQHEKIGVFRAVFKLRDLYKAGTVRLSSGPGAFKLYQFDRRQVLRFTQRDRVQAYRRVLGYTRADPPAGSKPNREFHGLLTQFALQVAQFFRDKRVSETIRPSSNTANYGSISVVRRAGLDFRNNVKGASYGHVNVLRVEVLQLLDEAFKILGSEDIKKLFGADNAWDVIEEVMARYMGLQQIQASQRNRMAIAGRSILEWLAYTHILSSNRVALEGLLVQIADEAEEWLTSAEMLGLVRLPNRMMQGRSPVSLRKEDAVDWRYN